MRVIALAMLAMLTSACWTPGPGQRDPTRYPWDQRLNRVAEAPATGEARFCVVSLEQPRSGIIVSGGAAVAMPCTLQGNGTQKR
jgi:hypothetical protein